MLIFLKYITTKNKNKNKQIQQNAVKTHKYIYI